MCKNILTKRKESNTYLVKPKILKKPYRYYKKSEISYNNIAAAARAPAPIPTAALAAPFSVC